MSFLNDNGLSYLWTHIVSRISEKYTKPSTGIPQSDLSEEVQNGLTTAATAAANIGYASNMVTVSDTEPTVVDGKFWLKPV